MHHASCIIHPHQAWRRALDVFESQMPRMKMEPDILSYDLSLRANARAAQWEASLALADRMERAGLRRSIWTYTTIAQALSSAEKWEGTLKVLNSIAEDKLPHSAVSQAMLITATSEVTKSWKAAWDVWQHFKDKGSKLQPQVVTALVNMLASHGEDMRALQLFATARSRTEHPVSIDSYLAAVAACEKSGRWELALKIQYLANLNPWGKREGAGGGKGHGRSGLLAEAVAGVLCSAGQWERAMKALSTPKVPMNARRYNISIACTSRCEMWEEALTLLWEWGRKTRAKAARANRQNLEEERRRTAQRPSAEELMAMNRLHVRVPLVPN
uniref:Pentatricopeptide repeat-containing protein-mitochondrial domain-containing protein n=1 Tax=Lotharella globosa TaxID=91324 RepID=A0A7S4DPA3_9EUKA